MKVTERYEIIDDMEMRERLEIEVNGKVVASFADGEPEDNSMCRNFADVHSIVALMGRAYAAGRKGEEFELTYEGADE